MLLFGFNDKHANTSNECSPHEENHSKEFHGNQILKYIAAAESRNPLRVDGTLEMISKLLDEGVDTETPIDKLGTTLMEDAIRYADIELFKMLYYKDAKLPQRLSPNNNLVPDSTCLAFTNQSTEFLQMQGKKARRLKIV